MKLTTKAIAKNHEKCLKILENDKLSEEDKEFILNNYCSYYSGDNSSYAGVYFTPLDLASDLSLCVPKSEHRKVRILDACAGIGSLSYYGSFDPSYEITCVEINHNLVEVGKKVVPNGRWIGGDIQEVLKELGEEFDVVISNPPFGSAKGGTKLNAPRYKKQVAEYKVIDLVSYYASEGVFLLPQSSTPFKYSGFNYYSEDRNNRKYLDFVKKTGLEMQFNIGIDTSVYDEEWIGVNIPTEIVMIDFTERKIAGKQLSLLS